MTDVSQGVGPCIQSMKLSRPKEIGGLPVKSVGISLYDHGRCTGYDDNNA